MGEKDTSDVPDVPQTKVGKSLGEVLSQKKSNPIEGLLKSGMAIKMLVGSHEQVQTIMDNVKKRDDELIKPNEVSGLALSHSTDLERYTAGLMDEITPQTPAKNLMI